MIDNGDLKVKGKPLYKNIELLTENGVDMLDIIEMKVKSISGGGMVVSINNEAYHFAFAFNSTWFDVDINPGDVITCRITRTQLLFDGFVLDDDSELENETEDLLLDGTETEDEIERKRKTFTTWHKWTQELRTSLVVGIGQGKTVKQLSEQSMVYFKETYGIIGFTESAVYSQLNKMGYRVKKNRPYKKAS